MTSNASGPAEAARYLGYSGHSRHSRISPTPRPGFRVEKDPLGYLESLIPPTTASRPRAGIHNFPISGTFAEQGPGARNRPGQEGRRPRQHDHGPAAQGSFGNAIVEAADEILCPTEPCGDEAGRFRAPPDPRTR